MNRCPWIGQDKPHYQSYHDEEWGIPIHDDQKHFEMLCLEGAQAGLSWETILKRRQAYQEAFKQFDPKICAHLDDAYLESQIQNPQIIRNRLKIFSIRQNARVFLNIQAEFGSFDHYIWSFVHHQPKINNPKSMKEVPTQTQESQALSKDLKKRGMTFVGPTIMYAYMQAVGLVDDHLEGCFRAQR